MEIFDLVPNTRVKVFSGHSSENIDEFSNVDWCKI